MPRRVLAAAVCVAVGLALGLGARPAAAGGKKPRPGPGSKTAASGRAGADDCRETEKAQIWPSPREPLVGQPLRLLAVAESVQKGTLEVLGPDRKPAPLKAGAARGGPPFAVEGEVERPAAGTYLARLLEGDKVRACRKIHVLARATRRPAGPVSGKPVWATERLWDLASENFYSAWIEKLFDAPPEAEVGFRPLHQALRDRERNFLWNYAGLREDDPQNPRALTASPDCADLPYFLRAYFAWKLGLPVGFRDCDRGAADRPPRCGEITTNEQPAEGKDALAAFARFLSEVSNQVHSGSARAALGDDETDAYPVKLERDALRPGIVYADPFGHVLVVAKWIDQTEKRGGLLLAVDGQPDGSVGRKRFWEGTFLFTNEVKSAGPGFKAFRPLVRAEGAAAGGGGGGRALRMLANRELASDRRAPFSAEQASLSADAFYARMGKLINPKGLDAAAAYTETLDALVEQLKVRIGSVDNGEKYMRENGNPVVAMPEGARIFESQGPWEDYSTPSRDMRLIIAMNVLTSMPERVVRHPDLYALGGRKPSQVASDLRKLHERLVRERAIEYKRSDGSSWKLTVADLLVRKSAFEIAYNPNDCVEVRWGAKDGTPEQATCKRHAPGDQRARMTSYRSWFAEAKRPPRP